MPRQASNGGGLEALIPVPDLLEEDHAELAATPEEVWARVRHSDLGRSPIARSLFFSSERFPTA